MSSVKTNLSSTKGTKVEVKSNAFTVAGRTNGIVPKPPKLGNSLKQMAQKYAPLYNAGNLPEATTPASGPQGRGLGKKGGKRGRKTHKRRKH
jgi:hypothetical protein